MGLEDVFRAEELRDIADAAIERGVSMAEVIHDATVNDLAR